MIAPLVAPTYFAHVFIELSAPTRPNGFEPAPSTLRLEMAAAGALVRPVAAE